MFGVVPHTERLPWHRMPEFLWLLTDLMRVVKPDLTVMDGFVIQEGNGPRFGDIVELGVIEGEVQDMSPGSPVTMVKQDEATEGVIFRLVSTSNPGEMIG